MGLLLTSLLLLSTPLSCFLSLNHLATVCQISSTPQMPVQAGPGAAFPTAGCPSLFQDGGWGQKHQRFWRRREESGIRSGPLLSHQGRTVWLPGNNTCQLREKESFETVHWIVNPPKLSNEFGSLFLLKLEIKMNRKPAGGFGMLQSTFKEAYWSILLNS